MQVSGNIIEVRARWQSLAERCAELLAKAKQLEDSRPKPVIDLIATSAALVRNLESTASIDLADDADKLAILAVFRDPDVRAALDTAGPRLRNMWLVLELKGYGLRRTEVKKVLTTAVRHLRRLSRYAIKILKAAEKELVKKPTPHRAPRDDAASRVRLASTSVPGPAWIEKTRSRLS